MLTLASSNFVRQYVQHSSPAMRADLLEIIDMMELIAPDAELVSGIGIPYFQQNSSWLYGVAARSDHLSVLHPFVDRLPHVQFGDNCLIIHRLDEINLNVLAELFGQIKVHFLLNHRHSLELIQ